MPDYNDIDFGEYSIKNIKTFKGMEGMGGFNLTLYRGKTKVAIIINDDCGGCNMYHFCNGNGDYNREEREIFDAHVAKVIEDDFEPDDQFIDHLFNKTTNDRRFKRLCKKQTLFRIKGDAEGEYRVYNHIYDAGMKAHMEKQYGDKIIEVLNDQYAA